MTFRLAFQGGPLDGLEVEGVPPYEIQRGRVFALLHRGRIEFYTIAGIQDGDPPTAHVAFIPPLARALYEE